MSSPTMMFYPPTEGPQMQGKEIVTKGAWLLGPMGAYEIPAEK